MYERKKCLKMAVAVCKCEINSNNDTTTFYICGEMVVFDMIRKFLSANLFAHRSTFSRMFLEHISVLQFWFCCSFMCNLHSDIQINTFVYYVDPISLICCQKTINITIFSRNFILGICLYLLISECNHKFGSNFYLERELIKIAQFLMNILELENNSTEKKMNFGIFYQTEKFLHIIEHHELACTLYDT